MSDLPEESTFMKYSCSRSDLINQWIQPITEAPGCGNYTSIHRTIPITWQEVVWVAVNAKTTYDQAYRELVHVHGSVIDAVMMLNLSIDLS